MITARPEPGRSGPADLTTDYMHETNFSTRLQNPTVGWVVGKERHFNRLRGTLLPKPQGCGDFLPALKSFRSSS